MTGRSTGSRKVLALTILALGVALWSAFLWKELADARTMGGDPFCAFGEAGACGELWDAPFASWVHLRTGVPVAGWGLIWGLAALALSGFVARRRAPWAALRWLALGGLAALVVLGIASAAEGLFCASCSVVYFLTAIFCWLAWNGGGSSRWKGGWIPAAGALAVAYLLLLWPGLETPKSAAGETRQALSAAARAGEGAGEAGKEASKPPRPSASGLPARFTEGPGTGDPGRDRQLAALLDGLSSPVQQGISDLLVAFDQAPALAEAPPRALQGPADAPVRIVEFTDTLCSHCATLHESLHRLREVAPEGSFSVDQRYYPLDGHCNRQFPIRGPETLRCLTARAKICMEGREGSQDFVGDLYEEQVGLTEERFWQIAEEYLPRGELEACVEDPATEEILQGDVALGARYQPRGTPLVLVNGKEANPFAPFLYALILTGGSVSHPAFAVLPAPSQ